MTNSNLRNSFRDEYFYSVITKFITILIGILQSILLARYLGSELKGVNAYISSITSVGSVIITFGMHQAYPYYRKKIGKDAIYRDFVSLMMVLYFIFFLFGLLFILTIDASIEIKAVFLLIPLLGYTRVVDYICLIEQPNHRNSWWTVISILDIVYILCLWLFVERNILPTISILFFPEIIRSVVFTKMLHVKPALHAGLFTLFIELIKYGFFPMLALLMTTLNYRIDVLMLHQYSYISDAMIGVYSLGLSLSDKIVMIPDTLKGILVSKLSKGADNNEVVKVARLGFWSSVFLCGLIIFLGKPVISLFYGAEYYDSYHIVTITSIGILSVSYFKLIAQYNIVNKKQKLNVLMLSIAIVVDIVLNLLFIPRWGINGAALATSIGNFVCGVVFIIYFSKISGIPVSRFFIFQKEDFKFIKSFKL